MYVRLKAAYLDGRRVLTSAAILAETLRGEARDAGIYRLLGGVVVEPVTRAIGEQAGKLIGAARLGTEQAVDAMLAATALAQGGPVLIVTSDVPHLSALVAGDKRLTVVHVDKLN
jgi:predicted nucleic acid-binding protein